MSQHLRVVATIPTAPEHAEAVRAGLRDLVAATQQEEGCVAYDCFESNAAPGTFVMVEEWASQEAMDAHMKTPHMAEVFKVLGPALAGDVAIHPLRPLG
ncbi:putative quinol monooxygenase [Nocardioides sp. SOB44]|uniref:Quinol monooxygenase n=2 Tax=Nocardioides TaxID=1839 RepID=A0ABT8TV04_9ACTN|nr:putative quinol monooxygenase [Nocardioides cremeus]MDO3397791.1 putative quinol monooxygenase [Nocardioides cremeus]